MLTIARYASACIRVRRSMQLNEAILDGSSGGWANVSPELSLNQYSSSHSMGKSTSKLEELSVEGKA